VTASSESNSDCYMYSFPHGTDATQPSDSGRATPGVDVP